MKKTIYEQYKEFYSKEDCFEREFDSNLDVPNYFYFLYFFLIDPRQEEAKKKHFYTSYKNWFNKLSKDTDQYERSQLILFAAKVLFEKDKDIFDEIISCIKYAIENPFFFFELGIDREDWINSLIWKDDERTQLHPYLSGQIEPNQLGYKIINYLVRNWFLPRYDFDSIRKIMAQIPAKHNWLFKPLRKFYDFIKQGIQFGLQKQTSNLTIPNNLLLSSIPTLIITYFLCTEKKIFELCDLKWFPSAFDNGSYTFTLKANDQIIRSVYNTPEVFFEGLFVILIIRYLYISHRNPLQRYLIFPRLLIGVLLGYLAALGGSSYWSMAILSFSANSIIPIAATNIILLFIVFLYIRYEVRKSIGDSESYGNETLKMNNNDKQIFNSISKYFRDRINIRSIIFFRKTIWNSFFIGLMMLDVFFIVYLKNIESAFGAEGFNLLSHRFHTGLIGIIDPVLLLFFFPLALISGVVIKFILDEKPISHPIK